MIIVTLFEDDKINILDTSSVDQLANLIFRSRYAHTPFGSAPVPILSS